eukprot:TRINITY_DN6468_c0_g2_i1.p1 TRINITY_DN6468_c0_g2~~TRINITY_DN6468_c0_g2_i1.p1  ORF type:complete len:1394 (+),score=321.56 TRINITY_DN6468_c0_g2_i1:226-4407(+)
MRRSTTALVKAPGPVRGTTGDSHVGAPSSATERSRRPGVSQSRGVSPAASRGPSPRRSTTTGAARQADGEPQSHSRRPSPNRSSRALATGGDPDTPQKAQGRRTSPQRSSLRSSAGRSSNAPSSTVQSARSSLQGRQRVSLRSSQSKDLVATSTAIVAAAVHAEDTDLPAAKVVTATLEDARRAPSKTPSSEAVTVVARIRPMLERELAELESDCISVLPDRRTLMLGDFEQEQKQFTVDLIFDSRGDGCSQSSVFEQLGKRLASDALNGYNICMFAYGHTGSGKTYTILGDNSSPSPEARHSAALARRFSLGADGAGVGLLPRFVDEIFSAATKSSSSRSGGRAPDQLHASCEFYEVYNDHIRDLLAPKDANRKRAVRVHPKLGVHIDDLCTSVVNSLEEVTHLLNFGNYMRTVGATTLNERSSRSHAIFTFRFEQLTQTNGSGSEQRRSSTITFVDLAGREDLGEAASTATKEMRFREMCYINTSLFHLTHLIHKLASNSSRGLQADSSGLADFRSSKLNLLLSQALAGNSRTALVATLAPCRSYYADSMSTLFFARSVKKIRTAPVVNNRPSAKVVAELEAEVMRLRVELEGAKAGSVETEQELQTALAMMEHYKQSWEDAVSKSMSFTEARHRMICYNPQVEQDEASKKLMPFFTKLTDDPSLQGCCNFFLSSQPLTCGSEDSCDILLHGLGLHPRMCEVVCDQDRGDVVVTLVCPGGGLTLDDTHDDEECPRVIVNGSRLSRINMSMRMNHGDSLVLGYAHGFRLVQPTQELIDALGSADAIRLARRSLDCLDMSSALPEAQAGPQFDHLANFLASLRQQVSEDAAHELLEAVKAVSPLVDEANLITREVFGCAELHFGIHALNDMFGVGNDVPDIVICVLKSSSCGNSTPSKSPSRSRNSTLRGDIMPRRRTTMVSALGLRGHMMVGQDSLLYVWSLEKFLKRLVVMREVYEEGLDYGCFAVVRNRIGAKAHLNPWQELPFADITRLGTLAEEAEAAMSPLFGDATPFASPATMDRAVDSARGRMPQTPMTVVSTTSQLPPSAERGGQRIGTEEPSFAPFILPEPGHSAPSSIMADPRSQLSSPMLPAENMANVSNVTAWPEQDTRSDTEPTLSAARLSSMAASQAAFSFDGGKAASLKKAASTPWLGQAPAAAVATAVASTMGLATPTTATVSGPTAVVVRATSVEQAQQGSLMRPQTSATSLHIAATQGAMRSYSPTPMAQVVRVASGSLDDSMRTAVSTSAYATGPGSLNVSQGPIVAHITGAMFGSATPASPIILTRPNQGATTPSIPMFSATPQMQLAGAPGAHPQIHAQPHPHAGGSAGSSVAPSPVLAAQTRLRPAAPAAVATAASIGAAGHVPFTPKSVAGYSAPVSGTVQRMIMRRSQ